MNVTGAFAARDSLNGKIDHCAVRISHAGKQCRAYMEWIVPNVAIEHKRRRHCSDLSGGDGGIKGIIQVIETCGMVAEIGHHVRISLNQAGSYPGNRQRGQPMMAFC